MRVYDSLSIVRTFVCVCVCAFVLCQVPSVDNDSTVSLALDDSGVLQCFGVSCPHQMFATGKG